MTTDYIAFFEVETIGAIVPISQENYKSVLQEYTYMLRSSEDDKELSEKRFDELTHAWDDAIGKSREFFFELSGKADILVKNIREDEATIKRCKNTIELIELFAKIRGWE